MNSVSNPAALRERLRALAVLVAPAAAGARTRARALILHQVLEAGLVDAQPLLGGELEREVEREAVGVVELERLGRADALGARRLRARDVLLEDARALLERLAERLLLAREPHVDGLGLLGQLRVAGAHQLAHDARELRQEAGLDADPAALQDRAPHDPAQDVAAVLVGGHDAVGDQERHAARVVGEDAQRAVGLRVRW